MVLGLIPYFLATEETELPGSSASAMILMIWSIENLFGLVTVLLLLNKILHYKCLIFGEHFRHEQSTEQGRGISLLMILGGIIKKCVKRGQIKNAK